MYVKYHLQQKNIEKYITEAPTQTILDTPWKFNIAPENKPSQKESNLPTINHHFSGAMFNFGDVNTTKSCASCPSNPNLKPHHHPSLQETSASVGLASRTSRGQGLLRNPPKVCGIFMATQNLEKGEIPG